MERKLILILVTFVWVVLGNPTVRSALGEYPADLYESTLAEIDHA